jgi:hypothetical protein
MQIIWEIWGFHNDDDSGHGGVMYEDTNYAASQPRISRPHAKYALLPTKNKSWGAKGTFYSEISTPPQKQS